MSNLDTPQAISEEPSDDASGRIKFVNESDSPQEFSPSSSEESGAVIIPFELITKEDSAAAGVDYGMEAPITEEDIVRAGGLGARDDIGSLLPSAMDATDLEASLRDAWDYEDAEGEEISRPGLGLKNPCEYQQDNLEDALNR